METVGFKGAGSERQNDAFTFTPKYYRSAKNKSAETTKVPKNNNFQDWRPTAGLPVLGC